MDGYYKAPCKGLLRTLFPQSKWVVLEEEWVVWGEEWVVWREEWVVWGEVVVVMVDEVEEPEPLTSAEVEDDEEIEVVAEIDVDAVPVVVDEVDMVEEGGREEGREEGRTLSWWCSLVGCNITSFLA